MQKKINLFIDAHTFDSEFQGSRTFIKNLYNNLINYPNFDFYFGAHNIENLKENFKPSSNIHYIKYRSKRSSIRLGFELPYLLKKYKIDYAHFQYIVPPIKLCNYIVTTHDVIFHDFPEEFSLSYKLSKHFLYKLSAKKADILTTVSNFSKQSIHKWFNIDLNKINIIPNAVENKFFSEYDKNLSKEFILKKYNISKFCLIVSRIEPRKNQVAILKAFKKLNLFNAGYSLVFIGTKSLNDFKLEEEINLLSAEELGNFFQLQDINEEDLINFYNAAELCLYPSKGEGFGIPPLESGALKVPTLCSDISAMSDFTFFEGDLFNPFDDKEIEEKIIKSLASNDENRLAYISGQIKQSYSWNNSALLFYNLFN